MESLDPQSSEDQARALAASRRILARVRLELHGQQELTEEDHALLEDDSESLRHEDLELFAAWHEALGTDSEEALREIYTRLQKEE